MQAVYSFTAASAGILSLTGTTVHMFDVYRMAGTNWIKLQQAGQDVSIGHSQPEVSITLPGEYIVVPDNPRQTCAGGATFAFTPNVSDGAHNDMQPVVGLKIVQLPSGSYELAAVVNGTLQQSGRLPLEVDYDTTGEVVSLHFSTSGLNSL